MVEHGKHKPSPACGSNAARTLKSLGFQTLTLALVLTACGGEDEATCGTIDEPLLLELTELAPADGSSVPNAGIVQGFTVRGLDALIDEFAFQKSSLHTAGDPTPATFSITPTGVGDEAVRYDFAPLSWGEAPSHVEIVAAAVYSSGECVYALPTPLFRYDVTAP
jgi:hypothetical protein